MLIDSASFLHTESFTCVQKIVGFSSDSLLQLLDLSFFSTVDFSDDGIIVLYFSDTRDPSYSEDGVYE